MPGEYLPGDGGESATGRDDESPVKARTFEVVQEAGIVIGRVRHQVTGYREQLTQQIDEVSAHLAFLHKQRDELDDWLSRDQRPIEQDSPIADVGYKTRG